MCGHLITGVVQLDTDTWEITVGGTPWTPSDPALGWGLDGIAVDLDASETLGPHYTIVSNTTNTFTVDTTDDLSGVIGNELIGVHTFQTLTVIGGASVSFGRDRLVILDVGGSAIDGTSTVFVGDVDQATLQGFGAGRIIVQ